MSVSVIRVGTLVRSCSDGFTKGREGIVKEFGRGGDLNEPVAFVEMTDSKFVFAIALRLLEAVG